MESLHELLVDEVKDLYSAENQITKMLPRMAKKAQTPELRQSFEKHLRQTEEQIRRLERIGEELGASPRGKKCVGMEGLIEEGKELFAENPAPDVLEAGMIGAAQKVEHYEIAAYGTARAHAQQLGLTNIARLLQQTLEEESLTNEQLTRIAESMVNREAASPNGGARTASNASSSKKSSRR
jgi:ferritin-like metal-binding protein YciE